MSKAIIKTAYDNMEGQFSQQFRHQGINAMTNSQIIFSKARRQDEQSKDQQILDKYRNHINDYVTRNNAERVANMSHLLSDNSEQFVPFPEGSQRYKGSERRKSFSH